MASDFQRRRVAFSGCNQPHFRSLVCSTRLRDSPLYRNKRAAGSQGNPGTLNGSAFVPRIGNKACAILATALLLMLTRGAPADDVENFYRGRTLTVVISIQRRRRIRSLCPSTGPLYRQTYSRPSGRRAGEHAWRGRLARQQLFYESRPQRMAPLSAPFPAAFPPCRWSHRGLPSASTAESSPGSAACRAIPASASPAPIAG